ncbi:ribbon-helix-helix domain-containing protein [Streptomyces sp. NPDC003042]
MKIGVSLPVEDVAFLDRYAAEKGLGSRSAALRAAIQRLRAREVGDLPAARPARRP